MRISRSLTATALLWFYFGFTPPLRAEVLVRISEKERAHEIVEINQRQIWLAMESGAYRVEENELVPVLSNVSVNTIAEVRGQIWLGSEGGLYSVGGDGRVSRIYTEIVATARITKIKTAGKVVWLGGPDGLFRVEGEDATKKMGQPIYAIEEIGGEIWVGGKRNSYRFQGSGMEPLEVFERPTRELKVVLDLEDPPEVVQIVEAGEYIWLITIIGRRYGRCYRVNAAKRDAAPERYFADEEFTYVTEALGEIWYGTTRGAFHFAQKRDRIPKQELIDIPINSITLIDGQVWIGTTRGIFRFVEGELIPVPRIPNDVHAAISEGPGIDMVNGINVNAITKAKANGKTWMRSRDGVYRLDSDVDLVAEVNARDFMGWKVLFGDTIRISARYERDGGDPYGDLIELDFEAILESDRTLFEKSLNDDIFSPIERLERVVSPGFRELHIVVRDSHGNIFSPQPIHVYVFNLTSILALLLVLLVASSLPLIGLRFFSSGKSRASSHERLPAEDSRTVPNEDEVDTVSGRRTIELPKTPKILLEPEEASIVGQRYERLELLGRGGMGRVYRARDLRLERDVALKFIHGESSEEIKQRFRREAELMAKFSHENIATIHDVGTHHAETFIVMEYIKGCDLDRYMRRDLERCMSDMQDIFIQVGRGLTHAHQRGVIHRDIKPHNVIVRDEDMVVKITDFGIAKLLSDLPWTLGALGTPAYMAPEQILRGEVSAKTDIYSLGIMLYQIATRNQLPFRGTTVMSQQLRERPRWPREINSEIVPAFEELIMHCIEKDPAARPRDAHEVVRRLEGIDPLFER